MQSQPISSIIDLLTDEQVYNLSGIKPKTLANWRSLGVGPKFVKWGHHVMYRPEDLKAFSDSRTFKSTAEYTAHRVKEKLERGE